jgi:hypothetical protein
MRKIITLEGELDKKGSTAYKLSVLAAKEGKDLKNYIQDVLKEKIRQSEIKK